MSLPEETLSSAEDFRRVRREQASEVLTLPSGLRVRAYRPSPRWWAEKGRDLPKQGAVSVMTDQPAASPVMEAWEERVKTAQFVYALIEEMVLSPRISLNPKDGEVSCYDVTIQDLNYLIDYGRGEITADGRRLETFPEDNGSATASPSGGDLGSEAERTA